MACGPCVAETWPQHAAAAAAENCSGSSVSINKNPWPGSGPNSRTLSGAGVGLNWSEYNNYLVRVFYARKLGNEMATSAPDKSGRFWIQAVKYF